VESSGESEGHLIVGSEKVPRLRPLVLLIRAEHRQTHRLSFDKTRTAQKMTRTTILLLLRVY
jgi:hypothetical protein